MISRMSNCIYKFTIPASKKVMLEKDENRKSNWNCVQGTSSYVEGKASIRMKRPSLVPEQQVYKGERWQSNLTGASLATLASMCVDRRASRENIIRRSKFTNLSPERERGIADAMANTGKRKKFTVVEAINRLAKKEFKHSRGLILLRLNPWVCSLVGPSAPAGTPPTMGVLGHTLRKSHQRDFSRKANRSPKHINSIRYV